MLSASKSREKRPMHTLRNAFSKGERACFGQSMVLAEMKRLTATQAQRFASVLFTVEERVV